ncbi:MAG: alpha-xylosidase [Ruminococcus sp.]|nr:alpha-xylosidase [Ruminococcus sp.]
MKFSDGSWLNKTGFDISYAVQVYETDVECCSIAVFATSNIIWNRAMTLGGVCLEIVYTAVAPDVIKISIRHNKGSYYRRPEFDLSNNAGYIPVITEEDDFIEMKCGGTVLKIKKGRSWEVTFSRDDKRLTGSIGQAVSYIEENRCHADARIAMCRDDRYFDMPEYKGTSYIREQLTIDADECVYGFGEKFTPFVKNGQTVEMWNEDSGTNSYKSYKCVPFYITSKGYGIFVNSPGNVSFEVGSETVNKVSFTLPGEELEYFFIGGQDLHEVLRNYTWLTGKPALPPAETFGLWLSTSFTTDYDEPTVMSFIDGMAKRDIPLQMFHFDCFWMKEYSWMDFKWDKRQFPDPNAMLKRLKERGIGLCCWINPYISQRSCLFEECMEKGYFIKNSDGSIFQTDFWQPGMAILDLTNPNAQMWFSGKIRELLEMGITAVKTDFGERLPVNACYYSDEDPVFLHNYYSYLYNKVVFETIKEFYGENKACLFARSATAGCQKFPVHWGGDCAGEFSSMAETLRGGLSLCSSGFGFYSHDIGGFENTSSAAVYKRWCAFGLMSTHSRLHGSASYRVPWIYDDEAVDVLRFFTKLKGCLMPYLYAQAVKTSITGIPMMRPMIMDFTEDKACRYLDQQYMLGDDLLCAPVFNEEGTVEFYLPAGIWYDIITGKSFEGGRYHKVRCSYMEMPILAKNNSIIAMGDFKGNFEYDYIENTNFIIFGLADGRSAGADIYDINAKLVLHLTAKRKGDIITVTSSASDKRFTVSVAGTDKKIVISEAKTVIRL